MTTHPYITPFGPRIELWLAVNPPKATYQSGKQIMRNKAGRMWLGRSKRGRELEADWLTLLMPHAPPQPLTGPLGLLIKYAYPWRKTETKRVMARGWRWCDTRPDADNIAKAVQDAMGKLRFYADDGQVARLQVEKIWSANPGVGIIVEELTAPEPISGVLFTGHGSSIQPEPKTAPTGRLNGLMTQ
jgi:Holliday junction resolvase RusA-like endonuclease